jgi:hypothetical protein
MAFGLRGALRGTTLGENCESRVKGSFDRAVKGVWRHNPFLDPIPRNPPGVGSSADVTPMESVPHLHSRRRERPTGHRAILLLCGLPSAGSSSPDAPVRAEVNSMRTLLVRSVVMIAACGLSASAYGDFMTVCGGYRIIVHDTGLPRCHGQLDENLFRDALTALQAGSVCSSAST